MFVTLFLFFISLFTIFSFGVSSSVYGGDSGDIILSAWFGGIAHPPGYPLNTMIGWIFTHLPYNGTVAYKANLMAAFFMAIAATLLFLIIQKFTKNIYIALASSLIFAFNPLVWLYAHIIEVFQLNLVLVATSLYFLISWRDSVLAKKPRIKLLYIAFLFLGLAVFHHQTAILIVPAYLYLILKTQNVFKKKGQVLKLTIYFCIGLLPFVFLIFASWRHVPTNWLTIKSLNDLFGLILRTDYGTFVASGFLLGANIKLRILEVVYFFLLLKSDFNIVSLILMFVGLVYVFFKEKMVFWFLFWAVFFTGPFFLFYAAFPIANDFYTGLWERFVLVSYFFLSFYIAYGFKLIQKSVNKYLMPLISNDKVKNLLAFCLLVLFFTIPLYLFNKNLNKVDMSKFVLGDFLGHDVLFSTDDNAIIFLLGDSITFNAEYVYYTNLSDSHVRSLKLIRGGSLSDLDYRKRVINTYPMLKVPQVYYENVKKEGLYFIKLLAEGNKDNFPIYIIELPPQIDNYRWMNIGLVKKLVVEKEYSAEILARENSLKISNFNYKVDEQNYTYGQFIVSDIQRIYFQAFVELSDELINVKRFNDAIEYLTLAIKLDSKSKESYLRLGNIYSEDGKCDDALLNYSKAQELDKKDWKILLAISKVYRNCLNDDTLTKKYQDEADLLRHNIEDKPLENF